MQTPPISSFYSPIPHLSRLDNQQKVFRVNFWQCYEKYACRLLE